MQRRVVAGLAPARVHVDHELDVAVRIGGLAGRHPVDGAAEVADERFALAARQAQDRVADDALDVAVQGLEVVRLPVVARTGREQRIERGLPGCERHRADLLAGRLAEAAQARREFIAAVDLADPAERDDDDLLAVHRGRQERQRRGLAQHQPGRHLVRRHRQ